ncbi:unnamed protein product [Closterium sp. Yama58-4]|nr:unnamed protein product [Closterium sp. Yama58-4]
MEEGSVNTETGLVMKEGGYTDKMTQQRRRKLATTFGTQVDAIMRRNLAYQKRNWGSNLCLVSLPAFMCIFLFLIQLLITNVLNARFKCGCGCPTEFKNPDGSCQPGKKVCGPQYTDKLGQIAFCEFPHPPAWPAFLQVPPENFRAADWGSGGGLQGSGGGLPPSSCRVRPANFSADQSTSMEGNGTYPCFNSVLYTGQNRRIADSIGSKLIPDVPLFSLQTAKKKQSVMLYLTDPPFNQTSPPAAVAAAGPGARRGLRRVEEVLPMDVVRRVIQEASKWETASRTGCGASVNSASVNYAQERNPRRVLQANNGNWETDTGSGGSFGGSSGGAGGGGALGGMAGGFGNMTSATGPNATNFGVFNFTNTSYMIPAITYDMAYVPPGSSTMRGWSLYTEEALVGSATTGKTRNVTIYLIQPSCAKYSLLPQSSNIAFSGFNMTIRIECLVTLSLWRANTSNINDDLYHGYYQGNPSAIPNQYMSAYDFQNSSASLFRTQIWYNASYSRAFALGGSSALIRFPRSMNLAVNAFVKALLSPNATIPLLYLKDFPRPQDSVGLDSATLLGPLFYLWMLQLLYPVFTSSLVYEKEKNLRMMMRMHGLKDGPYWLISYSYFTIISIIFIAVFLIAGFIIQLKMFTASPVGLQLLAYGVFIFMQISFSVLTSTAFNNSKVATVVCYFYVFGSGLMANFLFRLFLDSQSSSTGVLIALQLIPAFSIYHCLYEFANSAYDAAVMNGAGTLTWQSAQNAGFFTAVLILLIEALVFLLVGLYLDQVVAVGSGVRKHPLLGLQKLFKKGKRQDARRSSVMEEGAGDEDKPDVMEERALVDSLLHSESPPASPHYSIICDHLRKVYPGTDGNKQKVAVRDLSVAVARGECFGMLGPNGAGKTTTLSMMMGFLKPSEGEAIIEGMGIVDDMDAIYSIMGVCPQHDLLWEQLTGREHLLFYGRLKNLRGQELKEAVEKSLKSVNLLAGGVGDKVSGQYSGGMKRRLSVAISLIGNPLVVYMDEPSTGLDPASRKLLWDVVKAAKKDRAIVLTTHSMEEAEALCDRLGIFVSGQFECIGNARQLTTRYGGTYVLTVTTPLEEEENIGRVVNSICPNAKRIYSLAGTQKFEMPMAEVEVADVFATIASVRDQMSIRAWGFTNTTLEDVFIKIAKTAQATPV